MSTSVSPLAPTNVPDMPEIAGVRLATAEAGIRYKGRTDVLLAVMDKGTAVAGVFTRSKCPSAPVEWCRGKLKGGKARALVVNSGNANAFTGKTGKQSTSVTAQIAAKAVGCSQNEITLAISRRTLSNPVTMTSPFSTAHRVNCVRPAIRVIRFSVCSMVSSHPTRENVITSQMTKVIRVSQVRIHDSGPNIRRSR